jgi:hypothetical protein
MGSVHRPGAFKQTNKTHKTGRHRSKGTILTENKGLSHFLFIIIVPHTRSHNAHKFINNKSKAQVVTIGATQSIETSAQSQASSVIDE